MQGSDPKGRGRVAKRRVRYHSVAFRKTHKQPSSFFLDRPVAARRQSGCGVRGRNSIVHSVQENFLSTPTTKGGEEKEELVGSKEEQ
ncbi:hypothetical protein TNCT_644991 [Trichonephila clavata]|uniref:Uncharacterized protein n=1 Tax=Trichonephila clavata TaxID=2740835 RepID=A0A8X6LWZ4_TRICU|nr:hypothetical protein TNCT_644991 [Trichonephila clavata]